MNDMKFLNSGPKGLLLYFKSKLRNIMRLLNNIFNFELM